MQPNDIVNQFKIKSDAALDHFKGELSKLRTGRASSSMLDKVVVEAYGVNMPLRQVATVTAPEAQLIQVSPFDNNNIQAIASAIRDDQSLGLNPVDDGNIIRVPIPPLTTERRAEIAKQLGEKVENTMISIRASRHEAMKQVEESERNKLLTKDDHQSVQKQIDELVSKYRQDTDKLAKTKEQEIMTV